MSKSFTQSITRPSADDFMRYEDGEMDTEELIGFFQKLIDTGMAWTLQGAYGRQAVRLINAGLCTGSRAE